MSKRRLTNREQLRKRLKEAEPTSVLYQELATVQACIEKPSKEAVPGLIKLLKVATTQEAKHFIATVLGSAKDPRAIRPLMQAAVAPENQNYHSNFLWPLEKYDCTKHLDFFVNFIISKKNIKRLLAAQPIQDEPDMQLQAEHFRMGAAEYLMEQYFLQVAREYHRKPTATIDTC